MNRFLSEENIECHRAYVRDKKLKYSIIESSEARLNNVGIEDIYRLKISRRDKQDSINLLSEITLHDIYFTSFSEMAYPHSQLVSDLYGSEARLLNLIYNECMSLNYGFVCVYLKGGGVVLKGLYDCEQLSHLGTPILAVDVCEHTYFMDYGFDKQRYLIQSLPYLNLAKLSVPSGGR